MVVIKVKMEFVLNCVLVFFVLVESSGMFVVVVLVVIGLISRVC